MFVLRGDITQLSCDGWLLPTDAEGWIASPGFLANDRELQEKVGLDDRIKEDHLPPGWTSGSVRTACWSHDDGSRPVVWLTNTGGGSQTPFEWYRAGLHDFLVAASASLRGGRRSPRNDRALPLLAVPVIGIGEGGKAKEKGEAIAAMLDVLDEFVRTNPVDVALVTFEAHTFHAAQQQRTQRHIVWDLDPHIEERARDLAEHARRNELVVFVGAGLGAAAGLPTWRELLETLAVAVGLEEQLEGLERLSFLDRGSLLEIEARRNGLMLSDAVVDAVASDWYGLGHGLVASLPIREFVTTNYDTLLERAAAAAGDALAVLPYDAAPGNARWLLKLHGSANKPDDIVLTREHYLRYSERRGALMGIVQAMLITRHMVFLGFSLDDDNFHRIVDDVRRLVQHPEEHGQIKPFGTATTLDGSATFRALWERDLSVVPFSDDAGGSINVAARRFEIFLDLLLLEATDHSSYLLNPDYESSLTQTERALATALEELARLDPSVLDADIALPVRRLLADYGRQGR